MTIIVIPKIYEIYSDILLLRLNKANALITKIVTNNIVHSYYENMFFSYIFIT